VIPAPNTCRCAHDRVVADRDDEGDWTCTLCGRRLGRRASALLNLQTRRLAVADILSVHQPALRA
jgi:hypothetical protein